YYLVLKEDVSIILLCNLNPSEKLCNGTCLIVKNCHRFLIDAEILIGEKEFLPQMKLIPSDTDLSFKL
ncbi:28349_t:CDS:1, partial [Gigaspora margarita]